MTDVTTPDDAVEPARAEEPSAWDRFLFTPQSTAAMTLVRIGFGVFAALWALTLLPDVDPLLTSGELRYPSTDVPGLWNPLEVIEARGAPLVACLLLVVAGIATAVGFRTRLSSVVAVVSMLALQRTNPLVFNSGDLLLRQVGIAVALAPCAYLLSVDGRRARKHGTATGPLRAPWAMRLLQLELATGYFLSAWAKVRGETWHDGTAVGRAMRITDVQRFAPPEWLMEQADLLNLLTWATLAFEASFLFLVWNRRARPWVLAVGVAFHLGIDLAFDVGFFTPALFISYLAFLPPETADRVVAWIDSRLRRVRRSPTPELAPEPTVT